MPAVREISVDSTKLKAKEKPLTRLKTCFDDIFDFMNEPRFHDDSSFGFFKKNVVKSRR